jgi:hypothetical protein
MAKSEIAANSRHLRAICEEIGYRLGQQLDATAQEPSASLRAVLRRFEDFEQVEAPSIVPSLEADDGSLQTDRRIEVVGHRF